ncbi:NAD(P)-dependent oxidoreductase [Streptomyces millisiae]|uniref:NAD(P)-binding domain-containing protein n=1 Tax=Streptomyces millisiae TaxID=3075542 RepID=A0ABU2LK78_9ACTN|nr:NAD(P)-binding domain-containing protein [Streptomyces sp. DSM 44918]MDT0317987.1 NAD(P)-binding domain-containing protein [Streptomyces sp. DSM 44918]
MSGTTPTQAPTPVTVIGLGNLGRALAEALVDRGHPTTVWNRTPGRADALVARGARRAETVAEAVAASPLVVVCVLDYPAATTVLAPAAGALAGRTLVNITSGTPEPVRELAAWATGHGAHYLDGAVYAVPQTIGTPEAFVLYSGSRAAFDTARETLDPTLGAGLFAGTDPTLASVQDMAVLAAMYGMFAGFFHGVALAGTAGISGAEITGPMTRWLTSAVATLPQFAREIDTADYDATETSTIDINRAGLGAILTAGRPRGVDDRLLAPLLDLFERQAAEGHGSASLARAIESFVVA